MRVRQFCMIIFLLCNRCDNIGSLYLKKFQYRGFLSEISFVSFPPPLFFSPSLFTESWYLAQASSKLSFLLWFGSTGIMGAYHYIPLPLGLSNLPWFILTAVWVFKILLVSCALHWALRFPEKPSSECIVCWLWAERFHILSQVWRVMCGCSKPSVRRKDWRFLDTSEWSTQARESFHREGVCGGSAVFSNG